MKECISHHHACRCREAHWETVLQDWARDRVRVNQLEQLLREIQAHCGCPDAADGCRIIMNKCKEALGG